MKQNHSEWKNTTSTLFYKPLQEWEKSQMLAWETIQMLPWRMEKELRTGAFVVNTRHLGIGVDKSSVADMNEILQLIAFDPLSLRSSAILYATANGIQLWHYYILENSSKYYAQVWIHAAA